MTKPTLPRLEAQLRQLQLERNMGLHSHSERAAYENEQAIMLTRRAICQLNGTHIKSRNLPRHRYRQTNHPV